MNRAMCSTAYFISLKEHKMTMVATDGTPIGAGG